MHCIRALFVFCVLWAGSAISCKAQPFSTEELLSGFEKTVFGLEYRSWSWRPYLVKKFTVPVRFYVHNLARKNRTPVVHRFLKGLNRKIRGLESTLASTPETSNFQIFVVDRTQYSDVVRKSIYRDESADVPGRCLVRVVSGRRGIKRSAAVIVSDEGEFLFQRCLVEEVLQGLGPMNDDQSLSHSVFNDTSRHSRFTVFDQIILNMLYDPRIKPGMSSKQIETLLPIVARDAKLAVY
ncbi:DUF2927 domain-containing protein [Roseibium polysiphoniae]|uniref:DUF2927 domain-containing protein n=1 Tax=Roseibium polysiphoniae TaxID=2571221 RepID=A0A944CGA8_9HYPH|nr:DUF2927 domain-containing protein [Roseibium polysiphoniae]MBS8261438.1 DUF2927 domain-containing protein [Roseibium polysiphoniae]